MLRRFLFLLPLILVAALMCFVDRAWADDGTVCAPRMVWRDRLACPSYGPATTAARVASIHLPDPLPELAVIPLDSPDDDSVAPLTYAQVIQDNVPVYSHPIEAAYNLPPARRLGVGFLWVSVEGQTTFEGQNYYQINTDEYVRADTLGLYSPSTFQGVALAQHPERPFAWVLKAVRPRLTPQGELNYDAPVHYRYTVVQIFATEHRGSEVWYLIGPDQWLNQVYVAKVSPAAPPPDVAGAAWVDINIFEQTLAVYVGDRMIYATLISSGLPGWDTPPGLFQVWYKVKKGKMSGQDNKPDYYFLEDVPWALYFNQAVAMHTAYWHNGFGYKHSHGCINMAPADAKWLFEWAPDALWVWVRPGQELAAN